MASSAELERSVRQLASANIKHQRRAVASLADHLAAVRNVEDARRFGKAFIAASASSPAALGNLVALLGRADDAQARGAALRAVKLLALSFTFTSAVLSECPEALGALLQLATASSDVQEAALTVLHNMASSEEGPRRAMAEAGAVAPIVQLMASAPQTSVRALAANTLLNIISRSRSRAKQAAAAGAVPALAALVGASGRSTYLAAARTLCDLLRDLPPASLPAIQAALARDAMLQLLRRPGIDEETGTEAAGALFTLCNSEVPSRHSGGHSEAVLQAGVVEPATRLLTSASSEAQDAALALLGAALQGSPLQPMQPVVAGGGLQAAVALMRCNRGSRHGTTRMHAARLVMHIVCSSPLYAQAAVQAGAVAPYVRVLASDLQQPAILTSKLIHGLNMMLIAAPPHELYDVGLCRQALEAGLVPALMKHLELCCPLGQPVVLRQITPLMVGILQGEALQAGGGAPLRRLQEVMQPVAQQIVRLLQQPGALEPCAAPWALFALHSLVLVSDGLAEVARAAGAQAAASAWRAAEEGNEACVLEADRLLGVLGAPPRAQGDMPRLRDVQLLPSWRSTYEEEQSRCDLADEVTRRQIQDLKSAQRARVCCLACGATSRQDGQGALLRCGRCQVATYCSLECQKAHWREHKRRCKVQMIATDLD
jgi:hypothetical protein